MYNVFIQIEYFTSKKVSSKSFIFIKYPLGVVAMDLIPIKPSNNLIRPATSTANDGGSKSQSGYINVRTGEKSDELKLSDEGKRLIGEDPVVDDKSFLNAVKEFFLSILRFIKKVFSFKLPPFHFPKKKQPPQIVETVEKSEVKNFLGYTKHTN